MGARAWLAGDVPLAASGSTWPSVPVALDSDSLWPGATATVGGREVPAADVSALRTISVAIRTPDGLDYDGNPAWTWATVVEDEPVIAWEEQRLVDARAGTSLVQARVTFAYSGDSTIGVASAAKDDTGAVWRVARVDAAQPGAQTLVLERTLDDGTQQEVTP